MEITATPKLTLYYIATAILQQATSNHAYGKALSSFFARLTGNTTIIENRGRLNANEPKCLPTAKMQINDELRWNASSKMQLTHA